MPVTIHTQDKFVALFDIHAGKQVFVNGGKKSIRPTHDVKALGAAMEFIKDFKPSHIILGGDQLNCGPVSHWLHAKPRQLENFRLKEEMDLLDELVLSKIQKIKNKVWMDGNHEAWIQQWLDANPTLEGLVEPANYYGLKDRGYWYLDQGEIYSMGKLNWVHGDIVFAKGSSQNPGKKLAVYYRRNMRCGHLHTHDAGTDTSMFDTQEYHSGIVVPALAAIKQAYAGNTASNHQQGFNFGYVKKSGAFSDFVMTINKGECIWDGKTYTG